MRTGSLAVGFALIAAAACGGSSSPSGPSLPSPGTGGTGGGGGTGGQVDTAGVGNGTTTATTDFVDKSLFVGGATYRYKVFVPANYNTATTVPVILALHGAGAQGSDNLVQTQTGLGRAVRAASATFPAIVVFPQGPAGADIQTRATFFDISQLALELTLAAYKKSDLDRVYLTGLSYGGIVAFDVAYFNPTKFAAFLPLAASICAPCITGSGTTTNAQGYALVAAKLKALPIWQFHGELDTNLPTADARQIRDAFVAAKANYTYTELKGLDHAIWDGVYARSDVWAWLWAQHR
jgi:predicted peptidase